MNSAATLTAKAHGADGRPVPTGTTITFAIGADVNAATTALAAPGPNRVTAQTNANGLATASLPVGPNVAKLVAVASGPAGAAVVVSAPVHIKVRA